MNTNPIHQSDRSAIRPRLSAAAAAGIALCGLGTTISDSFAQFEDTPRVPNLGAQINDLRERGSALGFDHREDLYDPTSTKHWQSVVRRQGAGMPYVYLTISQEDGGRLVTVKMDSRDLDGERLRSNRIWAPGANTDETPPFPGKDREVDSHVHTNYKHPGGMAIIDNVLFYPLEDKRNSSVSEGRLVLMDVDSTPEEPVELLNMELDHPGSFAAVHRLADGRYLVLIPHGTSDYDTGHTTSLYVSNVTDLRDPGLSFTRAQDFHAPQQRNGQTLSSTVFGGGYPWPFGDGELLSNAGQGSGSFQNATFLEDEGTGQAYLAATRNPFGTFDPSWGATNKDYFDIFSVSFEGSDGPASQISMSLMHEATGHLNTENRQSGSNASLQAAGNFHVTPQGNLILYAAEHDNDGPNASVKMIEYTNERDNWRGDCHVGNAWIELYADSDGWTNRSESLQIDLRDAVAGYHDLDNLNENDDWEDQPDAMAEFLPTAIDVTFYKDREFEGDSERHNGTGGFHHFNLITEPVRKMSSIIFNGSSRVPSQWTSGTIYVDASFTGEPIGFSWNSPVSNLSHALQIASAYSNITEIQVAGGTYKPTTNRRIDSFVIAGRSVTIKGGYEPGGSGNRNISQWQTVLSGNLGSETSTADDAYNVLTVIDAPNVTLNGLIIERGNANGPTDKTKSGGGIHIHDSNLRLVDSIVRDCRAVYGGAVYNESTFRMVKSKLANNLATTDGGAIYNTKGGRVTLDRSTLASNRALDDGGAVFNYLEDSTLEVNRSTVHDNTANDKGGGLLNFAGGAAAIENTTIEGNEAGTQGGGLWNSNDASTMTVNLSSIVNNSSGTSGGGAYSGPTGTFTVVNSIIAQNRTNGASVEMFGTIEGESNFIGGDPMLAPLGNYGGDTMACPPLPGSPAIEAADKSHPDFVGIDQIGGKRPRESDPILGTVGAIQAFALAGRQANLASNDGDSIPDMLEGVEGAYSHLDPAADDSGLDSDGDGSSDAEEIGNMTDPLDPNSKFKILSLVKQENGRFLLTMTTFPEMEYEVEVSDGVTPFRRQRNERADGYTMELEIQGEPGRSFFRGKRIDG